MTPKEPPASASGPRVLWDVMGVRLSIIQGQVVVERLNNEGPRSRWDVVGYDEPPYTEASDHTILALVSQLDEARSALATARRQALEEALAAVLRLQVSFVLQGSTTTPLYIDGDAANRAIRALMKETP
jgi:hypothetical protein